jgi:hypothetical protein
VRSSVAQSAPLTPGRSLVQIRPRLPGPRSSTDRAADYGSGGCEFDSRRGCQRGAGGGSKPTVAPRGTGIGPPARQRPALRASATARRPCAGQVVPNASSTEYLKLSSVNPGRLAQRQSAGVTCRDCARSSRALPTEGPEPDLITRLAALRVRAPAGSAEGEARWIGRQVVDLVLAGSLPVTLPGRVCKRTKRAACKAVASGLPRFKSLSCHVSPRLRIFHWPSEGWLPSSTLGGDASL